MCKGPVVRWNQGVSGGVAWNPAWLLAGVRIQWEEPECPEVDLKF
jgi:hypothetical protein